MKTSSFWVEVILKGNVLERIIKSSLTDLTAPNVLSDNDFTIHKWIPVLCRSDVN